MRRPPPGSFPDSFGERLSPLCLSAVPGSVGQFITAAHSFTGSGDQARSDRFGWPVEHLGTPAFDWADADGIAPSIGPALTAMGTPVAGVATPWVGPGGVPVTATAFDGASYLTTATKVDPTSGQDSRVLILCRLGDDRSATNYNVVATADAGDGWGFDWRPSIERIRGLVDDDAGGALADNTMPGGWMLIDMYWDLDGNMVLKTNGYTDTTGAPGGDVGVGDGLGIGAKPDGTNPITGDIARVVVWYGTGLDNATDHDEILSYICGVRNLSAGGGVTFARASRAATRRVGTNWHVYSRRMPRAGSAEGLLVESSVTNECYNNINPAVTTGLTASGGTLTAESDAVQLAADGMREFGPNVFKFVPGGGDETVELGLTTTGDTNARSCSIFMRGAAGGETVDLGWWDDGASSFNSFASPTLTTSWARYEYPNETPDDTDSIFALEGKAGDTSLFLHGAMRGDRDLHHTCCGRCR